MTKIRNALTEKRSSSNRRRRRSGYVLVLVAMMLFGIMAMAALVIDIGFARLAQRQMQTAADAAALEGLRFRDQLPSQMATLSQDPEMARQQLEDARRVQANTIVGQLFDDNLLADEADSINFGAGPIVKFQTDENDAGIRAGEFINDPDNPSNDPNIGSLPKIPTYKPALTLNYVHGQPDDSRGDMVAGNHLDEQNPAYKPLVDSPGINEYRDLATEEYVGRFFAIPNAGDPKDAFLVRLRRTSETFSNGVGTSGPPLPYLFGRGSFLKRESIGAGIKLRATAIAGVAHVLSVGSKLVSPRPIAGLAEFGINVQHWQMMDVNNSIPAELNSNVIFMDQSEQLPLMIGKALTPASKIPDDGIFEGYVPIYQSLIEHSVNVDRVIGFGLATAVVSNDGANITVTQHASRIAGENASATLAYTFDDPRLTPDAIKSVMRSNQSLNESLLAPVLVR